VRIGLALPHYDFSFPGGEALSWSALSDAAVRAEELGFDSAWISDHFFLDMARYGGSDKPLGSVEPFTALAALATTTTRIRLGTLVACAPFRHPGLVAKMATVIDLLSGGRFELGLGAGWYEREFAAFGVPFGPVGERFGLLEETVEAVAALLAGGPVDLDGRFVRLSGAFNRPSPVRPGGPPIWVGGKGGERLLRLVARRAHGWNVVWRMEPGAYAERIEALKRISAEAGRDATTVHRSVGLYTLVGEDRADVGRRFRVRQERAPGGFLDGVTPEEYARDTLSGTVDEVLDRLGAFARLGVEEVVVSASALPFAVDDWSMVELVAEALVPAARELAPP
jgi:probable F420-dependent oxidoreductase